jgi:hypothetical protein
MDWALSIGLRTANRIICCVCAALSFEFAGWPGKTKHTSGGKYDGFCLVPTLMTGSCGSLMLTCGYAARIGLLA